MRACLVLAILILHSMYIYSQTDKKIIPFQVDSVRKKDTILLEELRSIHAIKSERPFIYNSERVSCFIGGDSAMVVFFNKNIRYPKNVKSGETEGIVVIRFVTLKNGSIDMKKVDILKSFSEVCDKEALRLVLKMPAWAPFITGGLPVPAYQTIGIYFGNKEYDIVKRLNYKDTNITLEEWPDYSSERTCNPHTYKK
ncbi:hypothetical protein D0T57_05055 [Dysgonomonas sp. 511]|nr:hypothetical protein [Dysgonomonas sp. 511]